MSNEQYDQELTDQIIDWMRTDPKTFAAVERMMRVAPTRLDVRKIALDKIRRAANAEDWDRPVLGPIVSAHSLYVIETKVDWQRVEQSLHDAVKDRPERPFRASYVVKLEGWTDDMFAVDDDDAYCKSHSACVPDQLRRQLEELGFEVYYDTSETQIHWQDGRGD